MSQTDVDHPVTPEVAPVVDDPEAQTSLSDHEDQFPVTSKFAPPGEPSKPDRDEESGQFKGRRHRAKSQQAGPGDAPRIAELTKKLREAEEERDRLKATPASKPAVEPAAPVKPVATVTPSAPTTLKKPDANDTKYAAGPYDPQFQEDLAEWKYTTLRAQEKEAETERQKQQQLASEKERLGLAWKAKTDAAKAKYADFQKVALEAPTRIPQGSLIDAFILESKSGADVLYHLQRPEHAAELDALLAQTPFEQVEALTLLGQRLTQPLAGTTGSAAVVTPSSVPRPPNPVRTGPMRSSDEPPDPSAGSLREHEQFYGRNRRG